MKTFYGEETKKALPLGVSEIKVDLTLIKSLAIVKLAAAKSNLKLKLLDKKIAAAIIKALETIIAGDLDDQFPVSSLQGGAGTSINMNLNEVVATYANQHIGAALVHPLDHVNKSQSTNDTLPTALKLTSLRLLSGYIKTLTGLQKSFERKSKQFARIKKVGRTHLQDAVPITLGQEFAAYSSFVKRNVSRLKSFEKELLISNLGGTAIGTKLGINNQYIKLVNRELSNLTGYRFTTSVDLVDATQNLDVFLHLLGLLVVSSSGLSKICSDLRLLASGPKAGISEISLPKLLKGSTIMPGKVNPVSLESFNQVSYLVAGYFTSANLALQSGQLELNVMLPVFMTGISNSLKSLETATDILSKTIDQITANKKRCRELLEKSLCGATNLSFFIGYDKADLLVARAIKKGTSLKVEAKKLP